MYTFHIQWVWIAKQVDASKAKEIVRSALAKEQGMYIEVRIPNNQKMDNCGKCGNKSDGPRSCPYEEDLNDNHEEICTCCEKCAEECAWEL